MSDFTSRHLIVNCFSDRTKRSFETSWWKFVSNSAKSIVFDWRLIKHYPYLKLTSQNSNLDTFTKYNKHDKWAKGEQKVICFRRLITLISAWTVLTTNCKLHIKPQIIRWTCQYNVTTRACFDIAVGSGREGIQLSDQQICVYSRHIVSL